MGNTSSNNDNNDMYPALRAWRRRCRERPETVEQYDELWRAAGWEQTASESQMTPEFERHCQIEAVLVLLHGKMAGDLRAFTRVKLTVDVQEQYMRMVCHLERVVAG